MMQKLYKKIGIALIISALTALISIVLSIANPLNTWHLKIADSLYTNQNPSDEIVIIAIDEKSISSDELGRFYDWPRSNHVKVLSNLKEAKAIGIDLFFTEESNTVTREELALNSKELYNPILSHPNDLALAEVLNDKTTIARIPQDPNLKIFEEKANIGLINGEADADGVIRRIPTKDSFASVISGIQPPQDEMLINYFGDPGSYKRISYSDVNFGNFNEDDIKDKIVLIGVTTPKVAQDHKPTPKNTAQPMPGIEIHANAIQTMIDDAYLENQSQTSQIITIVAISLILALLLSFLNIWIGIGVTIAIGSLYYGSAHLTYKNGLILNLIYPFIAIALTYFGVILYRYFAELREKKYVKGAFGRYLSPTVMSSVLSNPDQLHLGGTKREVTVFFSDIKGFTTISEQFEPEVLIGIVNEYLTAMTDIVMANQGTLDKYVGDAIVAYFGAPIDQPDHARRACETALQMREKLVELNAKWLAEGKPELDFRIGINTGQVIIGNIGSEKRFDYTMIGDEVNLGSRLEGANKQYGTNVMISESTYAAVESGFDVRELDVVRVKGKQMPVRVYELLARPGKLSKIGHDLMVPYNKGLALYRERKFTEARAEFDKALVIYAKDGPSKTYLERCIVLRDSRPPDNWDGVFEMKVK